MGRIRLNSKILLLWRDNNYNTAAGVQYMLVTICKVDAVMVIVNVNFEIVKKKHATLWDLREVRVSISRHVTQVTLNE